MSQNQEHKMTIPKDKIIEIYKCEYLNGISTVELGKKYNVKPKYFSRWFNKLGLRVRSNKENSRMYYLNDDYFKAIDTPEKAYWLGFIYADGYITSSNGKKIGITLSLKDIDHVKKFKQSVKSTYPIKEYCYDTSYKKDTEYCRLLMSSDNMYDNLMSYGVFENKTNIIKKPNIEYNMFRYFILGYFDGDGSIYKNNSKYPSYSISIVGTDDLLNFIHDYFYENNLTKRKSSNLEKRKLNQLVSYIRYGGNNVVNDILSHLYDGIDTNIPLDRKYKLFLQCKSKKF